MIFAKTDPYDRSESLAQFDFLLGQNFCSIYLPPSNVFSANAPTLVVVDRNFLFCLCFCLIRGYLGEEAVIRGVSFYYFYKLIL